jgi:hypothetical protein
MFALMLIFGAILAVLCGMGFLAAANNHEKGLSVLAGAGCLLGVVLFVGSFFTATGQMAVSKLLAGTNNGTWLVIDNSGGDTLRHWVIEDGYVESSSQSDGWQFLDTNGNLCYVSGDAFVMRITEPLDEFKSRYKSAYNIPVEQDALK